MYRFSLAHIIIEHIESKVMHFYIWQRMYILMIPIDIEHIEPMVVDLRFFGSVGIELHVILIVIEHINSMVIDLRFFGSVCIELHVIPIDIGHIESMVMIQGSLAA